MSDQQNQTGIGMAGQAVEAEPQGSWISRHAVTGLVGAGIVLMVLYLLLSQFLPEWRYGRNGEASSLGNSALGFAGFTDLLIALDMPVSRHRTRDYGLIPDDALVIIPTAFSFSNDVRDRLDKLGPDQRALVVLPRWSAADVGFDGWAGRVSEYRNFQIAYVIRQMAEVIYDGETNPSANIIRRLRDHTIGVCLGQTADDPVVYQLRDQQSVQYIDPAYDQNLTPVVTCQELGLLFEVTPSEKLKAAAGQVFLLSDPSIISNMRLGQRDVMLGSASMIEELREGYRPVVFDETLVGPFIDPNLWSFAFRPPVLALSLALLLLMLFWLWRSVPRFGAPLPTPPGLATSKHALIWNTADMLVAKGAYGAMAQDYRKALAAAVKTPSGKDGGTGTHDLEWLAQRAESRGLAEEWRQVDDALAQQIDQRTTHREPAGKWLPIIHQLHDLVKRLRP